MKHFVLPVFFLVSFSGPVSALESNSKLSNLGCHQNGYVLGRMDEFSSNSGKYLSDEETHEFLEKHNSLVDLAVKECTPEKVSITDSLTKLQCHQNGYELGRMVEFSSNSGKYLSDDEVIKFMERQDYLLDVAFKECK